MEVLIKDVINELILPHIPLGSRGFDTTVPLVDIVRLITLPPKNGLPVALPARWPIHQGRGLQLAIGLQTFQQMEQGEGVAKSVGFHVEVLS
jgi:hypothetical protein